MSRTQIPSQQILDGGVGTVDIAANAVTDAKLSTTGVVAGTYNLVTVTDRGRITSGSNPTTLAGYGIIDSQPLDSNLTALANIATTGLHAITADGSSSTRSITSGSEAIIITNGDGVAGNPTISLFSELLAVQSLPTFGIAVRTAADTWATRTLVAGRGITITNPNGIAGDITIAATGTVLQMVSGNIPSATGTAQISWSSTAPTIANGFQIYSQSFTPISATSKILIIFNIISASSVTARTIALTLFAGNTLIGTTGTYTDSTSGPFPLSMSEYYINSSTAPIIFSARIGQNGTGTTYVNQTPTGNMGGSLVTNFTIIEIQI